MALLWIDGFENYGTVTGSAPSPAGIVGRSYPTVGGESTFRVRAGRLAGYALDLFTSSSYIGIVSLTTVDTVVAGFAVKFSAFYSDATFFALYDGTTLGVNLHLQNSGEIAVKRGTTLLATSSGANIALNTWYYIELKVKCHATAGTYELRVGGVDVCSDIDGDANTKAGSNAYHNGFRFIGIGITAYAMVDDFYFLDSSGAINNDFLGNSRVVAIRPDANYGSPQFTPDSGDNYSRVNEAICGDDSNYVEADTTDEKDLYDYGALGGVLSTITGIVVTTDCRETDATNFDLKTVCKSGATESDDAGQAIGSTSYVTRRRIIETNPNTVSDPWTPTTLEAAQFGIKIG